MNNVVLNGPILQQKANEVAQQVGKKDFQISASWVQRFRTRHHIALKKVYKPVDVTDSINPILTPSEEWLSQIWPALCEGYSANQIFSTAETVLHYNIKPDELLKITDTRTLQSKTKVTLLVTANMTGSSKEKLLVIGEQKQSEFLNFQSVIYQNSTEALLTSEMLEKWLRNWDEKLKLTNEKILLHINNCSIQADTLNLNCIKLVILPNETSVLLPMDQVIRSFKTEYRKLQLWQMFHNKEPNKMEFCNLLDAILLISEAWERVTPNIIANAFQKSGLIDLPVLKPDPDENDLLLARLASGIDEDDNTFLVQSASKSLDNSKSRTDIDFSINNDVAMFETTIDEIKKERRTSVESSDDNVDNEKHEFKSPSLSEAIIAVTTLQKFIAFNKDFYSDVNSIVLKELKCKLQKAFELKISEQA